MHIHDSIVFVTGANRGLGRALLTALLDAGARRVYAAARDPGALSADRRIVPLRLDVRRPDEVDAAAARTEGVTLVINNAGTLAATGPLLAADPARIAEDLAVNFHGPLAVARAFAPRLPRGAALVNVLTVVSLASMPALGGYSASKAAAWSLTQSLRADLRAAGIAVHAVFAGPIDTDMARGFDMPKTAPEAVARAILAGVEAGVEDIFPDPFAQDVATLWRSDPKAVERRFGG
jgi:NAD(P)-dependent dehydrogenase (short-subunit alcohol dehydrogenase family)